MINVLLTCLMSIYGIQIPQPGSAFIPEADVAPISCHTKNYIQHQAAGALAELGNQITHPDLGHIDECLERLESAFQKLDPLTQTLEALDIIPKSRTSIHEERLTTLVLYAQCYPNKTAWVHIHHRLYGIFFKTEYPRDSVPLFELHAAQTMERTMEHLVHYRGSAHISVLHTIVNQLLKRRRALFNQIIMLGFSSGEARQYLRALIAAEVAEPKTDLHRFLVAYNVATERIIAQELQTILLTRTQSSYAPLFIEAAEKLIQQLHIPMLMYIDELRFTPQDFNHGMRRINILWKDASAEQCTGKALRSFFERLAQMHAWKIYENLHTSKPHDNLLAPLHGLFVALHQSCVNLEKIV
jgi:hypothetical protein